MLALISQPESQQLPSGEVMARAYLVLDQNQADEPTSPGCTAVGFDESIARAHNDAFEQHAKLVRAAEVALGYNMDACEAKQRLRINIDYSLALVVLFLRCMHASAPAPAARGGAKGSTSAPRAVAKRRWYALTSIAYCALRARVRES